MLRNQKRILRDMLLGVFALAASSVAVHAIPITQMGFAIDQSGSISTAEFNIMRTGYANAFAALPTDSRCWTVSTILDCSKQGGKATGVPSSAGFSIRGTVVPWMLACRWRLAALPESA